MDIVEKISNFAGIITIIAFLLFSSWQGIRSLYQLVFKPVDYIKSNHGGIMDEILDGQFGEKVKEVVDLSVVETLRDTGVYRSLDKQKSIHLILTRNFIDTQIRSNFENYRSRLIRIIRENSQEIPSKVGINSPSEYSFYVNLRSILPNSEEATLLSYILAGFIYEHIENEGKGYDFVAVNRNGNAILGYLISNFLSLPLVIVNYDSRWELGGKKVEIDGIKAIPRPQNKRGFLVDDAVSGGSILKESCSILRDNELLVDDVYVLFSRKEDDAINDYKSRGINLHSIFDLNDQSIEKILHTDLNNLDEIINEI